MQHKNARTDMSQRKQAVTSTAAKITLASGIAGKEYMTISNIGTKSCWIGASTVTSTFGYVIRPNGGYDFGLCTPLFNFYVVGSGGDTTTLGIFET